MTNPSSPTFQTEHLANEHKYLAPDGSQIRLLARGEGASMCHCTLPPGEVSKATASFCDHHHSALVWVR